MLSQLLIRNYAIVDSLEMHFKPGMSVITGETGAGKSIILGALGLTLGDRADTSVVRSGTGKAEISAEFVVADYPQVKRWLQDNDLGNSDDENTCLLRRLVSDDGRSKAYVNGSAVTLANLSELGDMLMDIHSQHEHQSLLKRVTHQKLLDEFGVNPRLLNEMHDVWGLWHGTRQKITALSELSQQQNAQLELIGYQVNELDELNLGEGESARLEAEYNALSNADNTIATLQQALNLCREDEGSNLSQGLSHAMALLQSLPHRAPSIQGIIELLDNASIQLDEASTELRRQLDQLEINPARLEEINQRLADILRLARKHRVKPEQLADLHRDLKQRLASFASIGTDLVQLQEDEQALRQQYQKLAQTVSTQRRAAARKLGQQINKQLQTLGMNEAKLEVVLTPTVGETPAANGYEQVEFLVATNPGQPAKPLARIASGGELSRISLAIQVITARTSKTPTLVFDEVDVGIGGGVAREVGKLLRQLGEHAQIICVTHQAQVAGQGHQHYFVSKQSSGKSTHTTITELTGNDKVREVARMLGGENFTDESLAHAEQMVAQG